MTYSSLTELVIRVKYYSLVLLLVCEFLINNRIIFAIFRKATVVIVARNLNRAPTCTSSKFYVCRSSPLGCGPTGWDIILNPEQIFPFVKFRSNCPCAQSRTFDYVLERREHSRSFRFFFHRLPCNRFAGLSALVFITRRILIISKCTLLSSHHPTWSC